MIDARVQELIGMGCDAATIFGEMVDYMPGFKQLMDTSQQDEIDELSRRFPCFHYYGKILEGLATAIQTGAIEVPK